MLTHYIAIGLRVWGKATTIKEAVKNARSQSRGAGARFIVYRVSAEVRVNEMGDLVSDFKSPAPVSVGIANTRGNFVTLY